MSRCTPGLRPARSISRGTLGVVAALVLGTLAGAGLPAAAPAEAVGDGLAAYRTQTLTWKLCTPRGKAECATYLVPVDYARPQGATMRVGVSRVRATGQRLGSMLFNPGGPGGSGSSWVSSSITAFPKALRERYDIVGFDARGVGGGDQIRCFTTASWNADNSDDSDYPTTAADAEPWLTEITTAARTCDRLTPGLRTAIGTANVARDMDLLRSLLGDPKTNYLGISYGTYIGAVYASLFPTRVGRFVLDSNMSATVDIIELSQAQAASFQSSLLRWSRWCTTRVGCPYRGGAERVMTQVTTDIEKMLRTQIPVKGDDPATYDEMMSMLEGLLSWGQDDGSAQFDGWDYLLLTLIEIHKGKAKTLRALTDAFDEGDRVSINSASANWAVNCRERGASTSVSATFARASAWDAAYPTFGRWNAWGQAFTCAAWPGQGAEKVKPLSVSASVAPIVVIGTTHDPNTPVEWSYEMQKMLPGSRLVIWKGDGHGATLRGESCTDRVLVSFMTTGALPAKGTVC